MASRPVGVLRLGSRTVGPGQLLVMAVVPDASGEPPAAMERVHAAVTEGADGVEMSGGPGGEMDEREVVALIAAVRDAYPELVIGVRAGRPETGRAACSAGADLLAGPGSWPGEVAGEFGAGVTCRLARAARAVQAGVPPERIVIEAQNAREVAEGAGSGWPVLVSALDQELAGALAASAVAAWLGARVFRVGGVRAARRALGMVSAIRGDIPPACAVRGLALAATAAQPAGPPRGRRRPSPPGDSRPGGRSRPR